jgi:hypothetical protein
VEYLGRAILVVRATGDGAVPGPVAVVVELEVQVTSNLDSQVELEAPVSVSIYYAREWYSM